MRINVLFIFCFIFSGCAVTTETRPIVEKPVDIRKSLTNIDRVHVGMSYEEVKNIMGNQVPIGYKQSDIFENLSIKNPYKTESLNHHGQAYEIVYYFTSIQNADGMIAEDELTPLIFLNNKLIGQGQDFLFKLKN